MFDQRKSIQYNLENAETVKADSIYSVIDKTTGKRLLIKMIDNYSDIDDLFLINEFRKLVHLSDEPEIVNIYFLASVKIKDHLKSCYVMDFIEGKTLEEYISSLDLITYDQAMDLIIQIVSGIEKAHHNNISHGDLHSFNIIINNLGYVKIFDFLFIELNDKSIFFKKDIIDIAELVSKIIEKSDMDLNFLLDYFKSLETLSGSTRRLKSAFDILFEISLLEDEQLEILSVLLKHGTENPHDKYFHFLVEPQPVPETIVPIIEEEYIKEIEACKCGTKERQYVRTMISAIESNAKPYFQELFKIFVISGLIEYTFNITNPEGKLVSIYYIDYAIQPSYKFIRWIRIYKQFKFITHTSEKSIDDIIFAKINKNA